MSSGINATQSLGANPMATKPQAIELAPSGRPYLQFDGKSTFGALLPDGYAQDASLDGKPWICPSRSCRKLFASIQQLGSHFSRVHKGCQFNDNGDTTLSLVHEGKANAPPAIISTNSLDPDEAPMVRPQRPYYAPGRIARNGHPEWVDFDWTPDEPQPSPTPLRRQSKRGAGDDLANPKRKSSRLAGADPYRLDPGPQPAAGPSRGPLRNSSHAADRLQEWEMDPGHITIGADENRTTVAYSAPFLVSQNATLVTPRLTVNSSTLAPGEVVNLQLDGENARKDWVCTIISGVLSVTFGEEEEFDVGPGGAIVAGPGMTVRIQNKMREGGLFQVVIRER